MVNIAKDLAIVYLAMKAALNAISLLRSHCYQEMTISKNYLLHSFPGTLAIQYLSPLITNLITQIIQKFGTGQLIHHIYSLKLRRSSIYPFSSVNLPHCFHRKLP